MKGGRADAEIKGRFWQGRLLEGRDGHLQSRVRIFIAQVIGKAPVGLNRDQRVGAEIEHSTRRGARAGPDLKDRSSILEATSVVERVKDPVGIGRPRGVIPSRVAAERDAPFCTLDVIRHQTV
jgi:hypothetical protein